MEVFDDRKIVTAALMMPARRTGCCIQHQRRKMSTMNGAWPQFLLQFAVWARGACAKTMRGASWGEGVHSRTSIAGERAIAARRLRQDQWSALNLGQRLHSHTLRRPWPAVVGRSRVVAALLQLGLQHGHASVVLFMF